ncbi:hypothetical protein EP7_001174 [Isosphaeraceae bacterium EP7]
MSKDLLRTSDEPSPAPGMARPADAPPLDLERVIREHPREDLAAWLGPRIQSLVATDIIALLQLVEYVDSQDVYRALAHALEENPALPPEAIWEALAVIEGAGILEEFPALGELWDELAEVVDEDGGSIELLASQLEDEPGELWVALHGLGAVEPAMRAEILKGLAARPAGPGLIEFLRLLTFSHEPETRDAAMDALAAFDESSPDVARAWTNIAHHHPDKAVRVLAHSHRHPGSSVEETIPAVRRPERCLVTGMDGQGRGLIVLTTLEGTRRVTVAFHCDAAHGVAEVVGLEDDRSGTRFDEFKQSTEIDAVEAPEGIVLSMLGDCLMHCGPETTPALQYWLERTLGSDLSNARIRAAWATSGIAPMFEGLDPEAVPFEEMPAITRLVLDACPDWVDRSPLTSEIAEEIATRDPTREPNPALDSGAYRFYFEHRLMGRLDTYRRMVSWMTGFWAASGEPKLARAALTLGWQLADAQHAVPAHPFAVEMTTRSLVEAIRRP